MAIAIANFTFSGRFLLNDVALPPRHDFKPTAVRKRFAQWIWDTCNRSYDQAWLDYQKGETDAELILVACAVPRSLLQSYL